MSELVHHASLKQLHDELEEIAEGITSAFVGHHSQRLALAYEIRKLRAQLEEEDKPPIGGPDVHVCIQCRTTLYTPPVWLARGAGKSTEGPFCGSGCKVTWMGI